MAYKFLIIILGLMGYITMAFATIDKAFMASSDNRNTSQSLIVKRLPLLLEPKKMIKKKDLPAPFDHILTQALLTPALENYYSRTAKIEKIYEERDVKKNTYSRSIIMFIDKNARRDNATLARSKQEAAAIELARITINFSELTEVMKEEILQTDIPFGKLLQRNHLATTTAGRTYFMVKCNPSLTKYLGCGSNKFLYGRTNTIIKKKSKIWLAKVVEILAGIPHFQERF